MAERQLVLGLHPNREISAVHDRKTRNDLLIAADNPKFQTEIGLETIILDLERGLNIRMPFDYLLVLNEPNGEELRWQQIYHQNALSALYFGFKPDEYPKDGTGSFRNALAVIEASSRVSSRDESSLGVIRPFSLDITGILSSVDDKHIVSVRYGIDEMKEAEKVLVSVSDAYQPDKYYQGEIPMVDRNIPDGRYINGFSPIFSILTEGMQSFTKHDQLIEAAFYRNSNPKAFGVCPRFEDHNFYETRLEAGSPGLRALGPGTRGWSEIGGSNKETYIFEWSVQYPNSLA